LFLGKKIWEIGIFKDIVANKDNFIELQRQEYIRYEDLPLETADGRHIDVEFVSNVYIVNHGRVIQCNIRDITKRKQAEKALLKSEQDYHTLAEFAPDFVFIINKDNSIQYINTMGARFLNLPDSEIIGKSRKILFPPNIADTLGEGLQTVFFTGEPQRKEVKTHFFDREIWLDYSLVPLKEKNGTIYAVLGIARDITERENLIEQIETSLAEKETLLREIHHRVKNNLQIISSMLNMQIRKIDDPKTIAVLRDGQTRVLSMALVHEHLYKGKDFSRIDLKNYLNALGTNLFQSYGTTNERVRFDLNVPDTYIDINTAIPLGLIINELITNSLKYAFKEEKDGKLTISATEDPQALTVIVADDGVGIPDGITLENQTSLGFQIVNTLTGQLHGTVSIDRTEGTKFVFTLPKPKPAEQNTKA
jgi:PAS domain S-box-containing protein